MDSIKKAGLILLAGFAFSKLGATVFKFIAVNQLPPAEYGKLALYLIMFNWMLLIATFNTTIGLAKFVSEKRAMKEKLYASALFGSTLLSLLISGILVVFSNQTSGLIGLGDAPILLLLAAVLPFAVFYNMTVFYFRGLYRMKASTYSEMFLSLLKMLLLIAFFVMGVAYPPYMAFLLGHMLLDAVFILRKEVRIGMFPSLKEVVSSYRMLLAYSFPIFLSEALRTFGMGLDRFFLTGFYTTMETGIYDLGASLCIGYLIIAASYANALLPVASRSHGNVSLLWSGIKKTLKYVSMLYLLYTAILLLAAAPFVGLLNPAYLPVVSFLAPMAMAYALLGILSVLSFFASAICMQRYAAAASAVFLCLALALNFYLVPQLKYVGAIDAVLISAAVSCAVLGLMLWKGLRSR
ncbi:MAG: oligosaccharide flippase family protein [Candidatus Aenigmatarchaeota archaeon]